MPRLRVQPTIMNDSRACTPEDTQARVKRWYDREPFAFWLPFSAIAAAVVQTVAYTGYKFFYNSFGVKPEEVGYDYTSLLPRTAFQLALLVSSVLVLVGMLSFAAAFYAGIGKPFIDDFRKPGSGSRGIDLGMRLSIGFVVVGLASTAVQAAVGTNFGWTFFGIALASLIVGHMVARRMGTPERSTLSALAEPRTYRGARRLLIIAAAASAPALNGWSKPSLAAVLVAIVLVYLADRGLPVVNVRDAEHAPGGGRSRWL